MKRISSPLLSKKKSKNPKQLAQTWNRSMDHPQTEPNVSRNLRLILSHIPSVGSVMSRSPSIQIKLMSILSNEIMSE